MPRNQNQEVSEMKFRRNNKIRYGQDFRQHVGIPTGVDFRVKTFTAGHWELWASGYGGGDDHGNGSLIVWGLTTRQTQRFERELTKQTETP